MKSKGIIASVLTAHIPAVLIFAFVAAIDYYFGDDHDTLRETILIFLFSILFFFVCFWPPYIILASFFMKMGLKNRITLVLLGIFVGVILVFAFRYPNLNITTKWDIFLLYAALGGFTGFYGYSIIKSWKQETLD